MIKVANPFTLSIYMYIRIYIYIYIQFIDFQLILVSINQYQDIYQTAVDLRKPSPQDHADATEHHKGTRGSVARSAVKQLETIETTL